MMSQAVPDEPQLRRLEQNATLQDVKKAYRNASLTLHPVGGLTTRLSDEAFSSRFNFPSLKWHTCQLQSQCLLAVQDKNPAAEAAAEFNKLATAYAVRDVASGYHCI